MLCVGLWGGLSGGHGPACGPTGLTCQGSHPANPYTQLLLPWDHVFTAVIQLPEFCSILNKLQLMAYLLGIGDILAAQFLMGSREPPCTSPDNSWEAFSLGNGELFKSHLQQMHPSKSQRPWTLLGGLPRPMGNLISFGLWRPLFTTNSHRSWSWFWVHF